MSDQEAREMTRDELILLNNVLREERDRAREECGHEKHMRQFNAEERDRWIKKWTEHEKTCGSAGHSVCACGSLRGEAHRFPAIALGVVHRLDGPCLMDDRSAVGPGDDETGTAVEGLGESLAGIAGANDRAHRPSGLGQSVVPNEGDVRTRDPHDLPSVSSAPDATDDGSVYMKLDYAPEDAAYDDVAADRSLALACPKCADEDIATSFHTGTGYSKGCGPTVRKVFNTADGEHLHHTCRRCGYDWTAPPVEDAGSAGAEALDRLLNICDHMTKHPHSGCDDPQPHPDSPDNAVQCGSCWPCLLSQLEQHVATVRGAS